MAAAEFVPDLLKVTRVTSRLINEASGTEFVRYLEDARGYLLFFNWCKGINEEYVGLFVEGILGVFLFRIFPNRPDVDEWVWVVVGDIPPAYLTCEACPNPATALDGYIGAMSEWVDAASKGGSVADLIPVNVPATPENAESLRKRLDFLDRMILSEYRDDLIFH